MFFRLVVLATLICVVSAQVQPIKPTPLPYHWNVSTYEQTIDHFNFQIDPCITQSNTWNQRYLNNTQWYANSSSPIFLYAGNEGDITLFANNSGFMWDIAPIYGAALLFPEHRYYGESFPLQPVDGEDTSFLQFLTAEQALADYAVFIQYWKIQHNATGPVVVFGGSYGGMLAAWMRIKYPHLVVGAIAASAPIWQFTGLVEPGKFNQIVTQTFNASNNACADGIFNAWTVIRNKLTTTQGRQDLKTAFHLCDDITGKDNKAIGDMIVNWIAGNLNSLAMGDYPYATGFLGPMPPNPVTEACRHFRPNMTIGTDDNEILAAIWHVQNVAIDWHNTSTCYNYNGTVGPSTLDDESGWNYQSCNEMIMPIGQYGRGPYGNDTMMDMFEYAPWNLTAVIQGCQQMYPGVQSRPFWINTNWPATLEQLSTTSNIFFSNGNLDPWSGGGVLANVSDTVRAYKVEGGAHHLDLRGGNPADNTTNVDFVRGVEMSYISTWIDQYKQQGIKVPFNSTSTQSLPASYNGGFRSCVPKSSQMATKWVAVISVVVTLAVVVASYFIYMRWFYTPAKPTSVNGDYQAVENN